VYAIIAEESIKYALAAVLNSEVVEFFHKQHARIHKGKAYSYIEDYTSRWPVALGDDGTQSKLTDLVEDILYLKNLEIKIPQFPDPYIADEREAGHEFIPVSHSPSSTYQPDPSLQVDMSGGYIIDLKHGQISDGAIDTETKARYVIEALKTGKLEKNQSVSILVPRDDDVAETALEELSADRDEWDVSKIRSLESEIDDIAFELFGIEEDHHREMIRRYNHQYDTIQAIDPSLGESE
jgi:hypothetical protein